MSAAVSHRKLSALKTFSHLLSAVFPLPPQNAHQNKNNNLCVAVLLPAGFPRFTSNTGACVRTHNPPTLPPPVVNPGYPGSPCSWAGFVRGGSGVLAAEDTKKGEEGGRVSRLTEGLSVSWCTASPSRPRFHQIPLEWDWKEERDKKGKVLGSDFVTEGWKSE